MSRFEHFVAIDWSGAVGPRQPGIAVAICGEEDRRAAARLARRRGPVEAGRPRLAARRPSDRQPRRLRHRRVLCFRRRASFLPALGPQPARCPRALGAGRGYLRGRSASCRDKLQSSIRQRAPISGIAAKKACILAAVAGASASPKWRRESKASTPTAISIWSVQPRSANRLPRESGSCIALQDHFPIWPFDADPGSGSLIVEIYTSLAAREAGSAGPDQGLDRCGVGHLPGPLRLRTARTPGAIQRSPDRRPADVCLASPRAMGCPQLWAPRERRPEIARTEGWTFGVL